MARKSPQPDAARAEPARRNSIAGEMLRGYVERVERVRAEKKELADDEKAIFAEARSNGLDLDAIRYCLKIRAMKPQDRDEREAIADLYLSALGLKKDLPLFNYAENFSGDIAKREAVIAALTPLVPANGSIVIEAGGKPLRLTRNKAGDVEVSDVVDIPAAGGKPPPPPRENRPPPPDVDATAAEQLGYEAAKDNQPIIANPFPFGDARRQRWDSGWRRGAGHDGMGPGGA